MNGKLLRISSEDKQNGETNSKFSIVLNNAPWVQKVRGVIVKSVSFKHVFPNIYEGNNTFNFEYNGTPESVTIPIGWYDELSIVPTLETEINNLPGISGVTVVLAKSPSNVSSLQKKMTFTAPGVDTITLINKVNGNPMADFLGILENVTGNSVTAQTMPDLGGLSTVYLLSSDLAGYNSTASSNNGESVPILTEIPITAPFTRQVNYRSNDYVLDTLRYSEPRSLSKMSFQLATRSGQVLDLGQHNLTIMLKILPYEARPTN